MRWTYNTFKLFSFPQRKYILSAGILSVIDFNDSLVQYDFNQFKTEYGTYVENNWERMKMIFKKNQYGQRHPEMANTLLMMKYGALCGCGLGAFIYYRGYYHNFIACSDAKIFVDVPSAQRSLLRHSLKGAVIGAYKIGPLLATFVGTFSLLSSSIQVYKNKFGIVEYAAGGFATGAVFRFFYGVRGMLIGGLIGLIIGVIYGLCNYCLLKIYGVNGMEMKYIQYLALHKEENEKQIIDVTDTVKTE